MKIENLKMPPFNTSLMGVIKGVLDHYGIQFSNGMTFGGSGHAFLINVHEVVCPSGPYCWKYDTFFELVKNLGLQTVDLGFFDKSSTADARRKLEQTLREHLDSGAPVMAQNMENQIITGHDDEQFILAMPWGPECEFTPPTLKFGTWDEFGDEIHATFFVFKKAKQKDNNVIIKESLKHAIDLFRNPDKYNFEKYRIGSGAYDNWIEAIKQDKAHTHGNWWNATVWSECRMMASEYFREIARNYKGKTSSAAEELSEAYKDIAQLLHRISDKEMKAQDRIPLLQEAKALDEAAVGKIEDLTELLR